MKHAAIFAILMSAATAACAAPAPLYQLSSSGENVGNGKTLNVRFQEITREATYSIAEVTFTSGGSVSSSMFALRATCGLARARGEKFFRTAQQSSNPTRFRIDFLRSATPADLRPARIEDKVFSIEECAMIGG